MKSLQKNDKSRVVAVSGQSGSGQSGSGRAGSGRAGGRRQCNISASAAAALNLGRFLIFPKRGRRAGIRSGPAFQNLLAAILLSAWTLIAMPGSATEPVLEALLKRDLVPFAPWYAAEIDYAWPDDDGSALGTGYKARLPLAIPSRLILIGGPDGGVIADVIKEPGPLALSVGVAQALGLEPGLKTTITVIALRRLSSASLEPRGSESGKAALNAPVPRPRPQIPAENMQISAQNIMPPVPAPRPTLSSSEFAVPEPVAEPDSYRRTDPGQSSPSDAATASRSPDAPEAPEAPTGTLSLQVGVFAVEANARRLHAQLDATNIPGRVITIQTASGSPMWRVVAGPFPDEAARAAAKRAGGKLLSEAYPIRMPE